MPMNFCVHVYVEIFSGMGKFDFMFNNVFSVFLLQHYKIYVFRYFCHSV